MRHLSEHYERSRRRHPIDELCVVFDIDGTILDVRYFVVHVLLAYDRDRDTDHFRGLVVDDITHHEDDIDHVLGSLAAPSDVRRDVAEFYRAHLWDREAILAASRPYEGVFGVIRWFQLQTRTQRRPEHRPSASHAQGHA
jgi:phosphoglycolate phosphatase-like HAD superfamily hydrolase